ncbi:cell wall-binding repeat-containing protein [Leifsonia sp. NPDC080035]|uniref:Cell wall-binding repeat-containing protein n=1 Tax=Leifsonia sp. NPDC080035 TaxID=3143936 RepID=A0AAU7GI77_9MICO
MRIRTRIASVVAAAAVIGGLAAAPASAGTLHPLAAIGSIDTIAVTYSASDDAPGLHVVGWAADANNGSANGGSARGQTGLEIYILGANGAHTTLGWAEDKASFGLPRPDVQRAHPGLGPNQGFERYLGTVKAGTLNICVRLYSLSTYPESATVACKTVNVPAKRPAFRLTATTAGTQYEVPLGTSATVGLSQPSGGTNSYRWTYWDPRAGRGPYLVPGGTNATVTPGAALVGRAMTARVTSTLPSVVIEQTSAQLNVTFPLNATPGRAAGADRYATAIATSQRAFPDASVGAPVAYVASGVMFPDALSAGAAAVEQHGTLLLTPPGSLDSRVSTELVRLHPARIVVVGGTGAVSETVVAALRALPFAPTVDRIGGIDRYASSRAVIEDAFGGSVPAVFLVTGRDYPDALAAAAAAAGAGAAVLLTDGARASMDPATAAALHAWGTTTVTIVGGTGVISNGVQASLKSPIDVTRAAGSDRFATAAAVARTLPSPSAGIAYLANGLVFADGLTTAILAGATPGALLLTKSQCAPTSTLQALADANARTLVYVGGEGVVALGVTNYAC